MNRISSKKYNLKRRKFRARSRITGTTEKPRLSVFISNKHVSAQIIDDTSGSTLVYVTSVSKKKLPSKLTERARWVGSEVAKKAKEKKISTVVFDRNGRLYHGRTKALADSAREGGLEF